MKNIRIGNKVHLLRKDLLAVEIFTTGTSRKRHRILFTYDNNQTDISEYISWEKANELLTEIVDKI